MTEHVKKLLEWYSLVRKNPNELSIEEANKLLELSMELGFTQIPIATNGDNPYKKQLEEEKLKPTTKESIVMITVRELEKKYHFINIYDVLECYENGVYVECEEKIKHEIEVMLEKYELPEKTTNTIVNEITGKLKRRHWRDPDSIEADRYTLAFSNGLVDIEGFVNSGFLEIKPFTPEIYVQHYIPHRIESLNEFIVKEYGLEAYSDKTIDVLDLAEKQVPFINRVFSEWVEKPELLYEIMGYCYYKAYPIHRAFMLVGEGSNGKSTYLGLLKHVLGPKNTTSITLQAISEQRFAASQLYRKLANIYADLPRTPLRFTGTFKILTGEDQICADRKFKDPICFVNYAKLIFSANELPEVSDQTYAFWRRWVLLKFPYTFPPNKEFEKQLLESPEIPKLITVSLYALRNVFLRNDFSEKAAFKDEWMRLANNVYAFIQDKLEKCEPTEEDCFVVKENLYNTYKEYCEENDLPPYSQTKFTIELKRLIPKLKQERKRFGSERKRVWKGIRLKYYEEEEENGQQTLF